MQSYTVAFRDVKVPVSGSYISLVSPDPRPPAPSQVWPIANTLEEQNANFCLH